MSILVNRSTRVIVQGLGNVGYHPAKFFQEAGAKIVALAEYEGSIWSETGLDVEKVFEIRNYIDRKLRNIKKKFHNYKK